jgi:poly(3-hydroxybutyrate) depolymerase
MFTVSQLSRAAALLLLALSDLTSAAKPSPGCGKAAGISAGNHTLTVNAKSRWYLLKTPEAYDNNHPYRLIFTLHAMGGNPTLVANGEGGYLPWYGLPALVTDSIGAIYVNPNGLDRGWANRGGEDVTLMLDILKTVKENLCIDENLVFSVGFSYGASMSTALACSAAKQFRAISAQSGGLMSGCAGGDDPIAFYGQHGVDGDLNITAARGIRDRFIKNNGCTQETFTPPAIGSGTHTKVEYKGCKEGYPVTWLEYDGGHTPQPRDKGANATYSAVETWKFFSQFK